MMSGRRADGAMMTGSKAKRSVLFAFGVAAAILLALGGFAYRSVLLTVESDRRLQHTHEVLENLQDLQFAMEGVASASRGYTITGEERYLEPYHAAGLSLMEHTAIVRNLTADNAEQQRRIPALEKLATERLENTDETINLRRDRGLVAATEATQTGRGLRITTEYQAIIAQMEGEEQRLLVLRNVETERNRSRTKIILILGSVLGLLITVAAGWRFQQENSRREVAEDTLRESERKYRLLIDGVKEYAIMMLGPLGEIRSWNPGAERMSGCTYEEVAGQNYSRFFTQNEIKLGRPEEILRLAAANGEFEELGMRVRKDGTRYQVRTSFTASRDPAGILRGFSIVSRDLSESKESEVKYRGLLEAAPDAMVVVNQAGDIVLLNLQAEKQFGYRRDELLGQKVTNIIPKGFAERLIADDLRSAEDALAQQIGTGIELIARRKDGAEFPIEIMLSPLRNTEGILVTAATRIQEMATAASSHSAAQAAPAGRSDCGSLC